MKNTETGVHPSATEKIWRKLADRLRKFIVSELKSEADADDVLQDVFIKIHTRLHTVRETEKLTSWAFQITRNAIHDFRRAKKRHNITTALVDEIPEPLDDAGDNHANCVIPFLKALPAKYREAVLMTDLKGIGQTELQKQLGISYSGVKSRVQRGRKLLLDRLVSCCKKAGSYVGDLSCISERSCECSA